MSKIKIFSMLNADERPNLDEVNNEPSMTVPDQAMDLREILIRFASGQDIPVGHDLPYHDEDELDSTSGIHFNKLDLVDRDNLREQISSKINSLQTELNKPDDPVEENKSE